MGKLRVVLANIPQILKQILRDLVDRQPDMAIVAEVRTLVELPVAIASLQAQAVILTLPPPGIERSMCDTLRAHNPELTFVGLAPRHDRAVAWSPHTAPKPIEMSAGAILSALRGAITSTAGRDRKGGVRSDKADCNSRSERPSGRDPADE